MANRQRLLAGYAVYKGNMNPRRDLERQAYEAEVARVAASHNVDAKDLLDALSGDWGSYKRLKALPLTGAESHAVGMFGSWQNLEYAVPANREERLGQVLRQINDVGELDYLQKLGATAYQTTLEMANIDRQMQRALRAGGGSSGSTGRSGGGGGGRSAASVPATSMWSGTLADYALQIRGLQTQQQNVTNRTEYARLQRHIDYIQQQIDFIKGKQGATLGESLGGSTDYWAGVKEKLNAPLDVKLIEGPVRELTSGANTVKVSWQDAAAAIQSVGQAFSMIENPAAKVVGIIGQAIATIALGFAQATTQAAAGGPFAWIAAIAGGLGTMITTIAAIKQATAGSYADGGIIPGNNHNDGLIANVSSGELILNAAQQRNVVNALYGQRAGGNSQPYVNAETIVLGVNNYYRRIGRGEIVTTR
jgi:hypothetical protein